MALFMLVEKLESGDRLVQGMISDLSGHRFYSRSLNGSSNHSLKKLTPLLPEEKNQVLCSCSSFHMASPNPKEIVAEIPTYIRVFSDGTVERPRETPFVPPSIDDPQTGVSSKDIVISQNPLVSARIYLPKLTTINQVPILVFFHGGGFFFESAFSQLYHHHFNTFVSQTNCIVVSVEYRLAPEHPLPACYLDCWEALKWVASHSSENSPINAEQWLISHGNFQRVFIGGDSAGGNIVHNIAMRAGTEPLPCGVKLLGAIFAHPYFCSSYPIGSEPVTGHEQSLPYVVWDFVYPSVPGGIDNPMVNPVAPGAPSLAELGCSKIIVCVASEDKLRDRGVWYYEAVKKSGWKGDLELFEENGEDHVYHIFHPESENATKLIKRLGSPFLITTIFMKDIISVVTVSENMLAPENPLPAAYEDSWEALKWWLIKHGDFNRFYIGGDTAGANIAHNAVLRAGVESESVSLLGGMEITGAVLAFPLFWSSEPVLSEPVEGFEESSAMQVWKFVYPDGPGGIDQSFGFWGA
ncbi:2-hydroxyisoflavanone dehydratase [Glycine soja]